MNESKKLQTVQIILCKPDVENLGLLQQTEMSAKTLLALREMGEKIALKFTV